MSIATDENINSGLLWVNLSPVERAARVIECAMSKGIDTGSITAKPLAAAMSRHKYWAQGPDDYFDMLKSIVAYLAVR